MALIVEIKVNDRLIAKAVAGNISDLSDNSDYIVRGLLDASPFNGNVTTHHKGKVIAHDRNTPVWELVRKMMEVLIDDPKPTRFLGSASHVDLSRLPQEKHYGRSKSWADRILTHGSEWPGS